MSEPHLISPVGSPARGDGVSTKKTGEAMIHELAIEMASFDSGLKIKSRKYLLRVYPECFVGSQAVDWIVKNRNYTRSQAIRIGNYMVTNGLVRSCVDPNRTFIDGNFFYHFTEKVETKRKKQLITNKNIPTSIEKIVELMKDPKNGLDIKDRRYLLKLYPSCFIGSEAVDWMMRHLALRSRAEAVELGMKLVRKRYIESASDPLPFRDKSSLYYRFTKKEMIEEDATEEKSTHSPEDFEKLKVIGEGGYGIVFLVRKRDTGKIYACKILDKSKLISKHSIEHIATEQKVLINDCPFLLHLHYSFQTNKKLYLVTDFLPGGDLFYHLAKRKSGGFNPFVVRFFVAELVLALGHLHKCGVIYRDMKLENVLLDEIGHICLADFGLSKLLPENVDRTKTLCGSQGYFAPEVLTGEPYSYTVDWFSLGVITYELLTADNPFLGDDLQETCSNIINKDISFSKPVFKPVIIDFINKATAKNPAQRFQTASEIKRHPWFKNIHWEKLAVKKLPPPFQFSVPNPDNADNFDKFDTVLSEDFSGPSLQEFDENAFTDFDASFPRM